MTQRFVNGDGLLATGDNTTSTNLFAYCGNNPVNRCDPSGQFWLTALIVTAVVATVATIGYHHVSKRNSRRNSKVDSNPSTTTKNKIINDQNGTTGENFEYGMHKASWNACETIAVHNAKVIKGIDSSLSETMEDFQSSGAMIGYGTLGSNPYQIGSVLSDEGIEYYRVSSTDNMTLYGTYIMSFWNGKPWCSSLHTIAFSYTSQGCVAYNLYGDGNSTPNFDPSIYSDSYACGYYLY